MNTTSAVTVRTPDGDFTMLLSCDSVLASGWTDDVSALAALVHPMLRPERGDIVAIDPAARHEHITPAVEAISAYYDGELGAIDKIPVRQHSGEFRMHAWDILRQVRPGDRVTYTDYAVRAGRPAAVRAAAGACALNAVALFVPCHRVLRLDGTLGGFRWGLPVKRRLLERESPEEAGRLF